MIRIIEDDDKFESTAKNYQKKTKRWRWLPVEQMNCKLFDRIWFDCQTLSSDWIDSILNSLTIEQWIEMYLGKVDF